MHLLIVDDEVTIRKGLKKMMESYAGQHLVIELASNGLDALERIEQKSPDVVITDIRMPRMDGVQLCQHLYDRYPLIQIIVISGYDDFSVAQQCLAFGVSDYLLKPVTKKDLHRSLDKLVTRQGLSLLSVSQVESWLERLEAELWELQAEAVANLAKEWITHHYFKELSLSQLRSFFEDCLVTISKRMHLKNFYPVVGGEIFQSCRTAKQIFQRFEEELLEILKQLVRHQHGNTKDPVEEAKLYLEQYLSANISLEEVSGMFDLTPTYFSYLFKKKTGSTFVQYRTTKRIEKAKQLLEIPHYRIIDIAKEVGYEDYTHFTKIFKKMTGYTPSDYRAMMGIH